MGKRKTLGKKIDVRVDDELDRQLERRARQARRSKGAVGRAIWREVLQKDDAIMERILTDLKEA